MERRCGGVAEKDRGRGIMGSLIFLLCIPTGGIRQRQRSCQERPGKIGEYCRLFSNYLRNKG